MRQVCSASCSLMSSRGVSTITRLQVCEKGVYAAPGPLMSTMPSCAATRRPAVKTAMPSKTRVLPLPTVSTGPMKPGKTSPGPSSLQRGSTTSFTGIIRVLSPGWARSKSTNANRSSSRSRALSSSLLMVSVPCRASVLSPNLSCLIATLQSSSFTENPPERGLRALPWGRPCAIQGQCFPSPGAAEKVSSREITPDCSRGRRISS